MTVLPLLGLATIKPLWPFPIGATISITRLVLFSSTLESLSNTRGLVGCIGVKFSNRILFFVFSGASLLTLSTLTRAK